MKRLAFIILSSALIVACSKNVKENLPTPATETQALSNPYSEIIHKYEQMGELVDPPSEYVRVYPNLEPEFFFLFYPNDGFPEDSVYHEFAELYIFEDDEHPDYQILFAACNRRIDDLILTNPPRTVKYCPIGGAECRYEYVNETIKMIFCEPSV